MPEGQARSCELDPENVGSAACWWLGRLPQNRGGVGTPVSGGDWAGVAGRDPVDYPLQKRTVAGSLRRFKSTRASFEGAAARRQPRSAASFTSLATRRFAGPWSEDVRQPTNGFWFAGRQTLWVSPKVGGASYQGWVNPRGSPLRRPSLPPLLATARLGWRVAPKNHGQHTR